MIGLNVYNNDGYGIKIVGLNITVVNNTATNNGNAGIVIESDYVVVSGNTVTGNANNRFSNWVYEGIHIVGDNVIVTSDNVIHDNYRTGLYVYGNNIDLIGLNVYNNDGYGIKIVGLNITVVNNTVASNGNAGIVIESDYVVVSGNTVTGNGNNRFINWEYSGIDVTGTSVIVIGNTATGNGRIGITVNGDNAQILQNYVAQNVGYGISAAGINITVINNTATSNGNAGIVIDSDNAIVSGNTATGNANQQISNWAHNAIHIIGDNAIINGNIANGNSVSGIYVNGVGAFVSENTVTNNEHGIYFLNGSGTIQSNNITGNQYGVYLSNSLINIYFNTIVGNSKYGLYNTGNGTANATNNWWGSNNGPSVSSTSPSDIYIVSGTLTYDPWLVLNISADPKGTISQSTITADLTYNNEGSDTSSQGNFPDNIPVTFITDFGTITSPTYTRNGKACAIFNRGASSSGIANVTATLDNQTVQTNVFFNETSLLILVDPVGGFYNTTQNVTFTTIVDPNRNTTTYYTTDGSDPRVNGIIYSNPILINSTTTLRYIASDSTDNWGIEYTQTYIIDTTPPTVTVNLIGGIYNTTQTLNFTVTDDLDPNTLIYYTTDGSDPTTSSAIYTSPITLQMNLTRVIIELKYIAVDHAGNQAQIQTETYILTLPVVDINNNKTYSLIQDAINDNSTLNGDVIQIYSGTYSETVIVNKKITIMPVSENNVIIQAADPNGNVFTITNNGSGSIIQELTINGNINLQANNCTIYLNTIIGNGTSGIITSNSFNNTLAYNTITCNGFNGIECNSSSNVIYGNTISGCDTGIYSEGSNNNIISNNLINNQYGIWTNNSTDTIQFNRIAQNTYGLRNDIGTVNATNNWWGTNNPINPSDIWIVSGNVTYNPWLVLNVNPSSTNSGGNTSVTADLTHNNQGENIIPQGHIPNGVPVNFASSSGTIVNTAYTLKGQAVTILNLNTTEPQTVTVSASLDNQTVSSTGLIATGVAVLNINSTAIDNSTGLPLNITYSIPLNSSVTWLSVLWINTGMFTDELQIIVDGQVVQDKYFNNTAYTAWQSSYPPSIFSAISYANQNLQFVSSTALTEFWNNLTTTYNLTTTELEFIQNHRKEFIDNLTANIVYSGIPGLNLTVTDPQNNNTINLNFPGNVIQRTSQIVYTGSPYEGVKSFAIATTKVTNTVLQYWLEQYPNYQNNSVMNSTYNTFLTALMVEYVHDQFADNISTRYNVTWSRTSPIIVSVSEDVSQTYMTLECDHSMGMTVVGSVNNMWMFNYICSSAISPIEYAIMSNATDDPNIRSVTLDLLRAYLFSSTSIEAFVQNGFLIEKSVYNDDNFIVVDLETGIVRDIYTVDNLCGSHSPYSDYSPFDDVESICYISSGFLRPVSSRYEEVSLGSRSFWWDGVGDVILTNSANCISADDLLVITGPGVSIADLLQKDEVLNNIMPNTISVSVKDLYDGLIGCSELYLVLVGGPETFPHKMHDIYDLCNDLINGEKHLNTDKIGRLTVGGVMIGVGIVGLYGGLDMFGAGCLTVDPVLAGGGAVITWGALMDIQGASDFTRDAMNMPWFT